LERAGVLSRPSLEDPRGRLVICSTIRTTPRLVALAVSEEVE
jgi:hypothetical protein